MNDLVAWLRPQIEERKTRAEAALAFLARLKADDETAHGGWEWWGDFGHLVDPLINIRLEGARCKADLAILDEHYGVGAPRHCRRCSDYDETRWDDRVIAAVPSPCRTVRLLAWGYRRLDPKGYAAVAEGWQP